MKILVLGFGNAKGRYNPPSTYCENYITHNTGGNEIITFGYNEGVDITISPEDEFEKVLERLPHGWTPDLCLLWLMEWNLLPRGIERAPFPTAACVFDWDYDVPYSRYCMEAVDLTIVTGDYDREAIEAIGANSAVAFYFSGVINDFINPQPKKIKDRKYDILYTTWIDHSAQPGRSEWIFRLASLSDKYNVHINKNLSYPEYLALLNDTKLVLSYNRHGSMAVRTTDAGTQGTVVLETGSGAGRYFVPDEDYIPVSEENYAAQIERYLKDEEMLQAMSDRFYKKVQERFKAEGRFIELIEFALDKIRSSKSRRKAACLTEGEGCLRRGEQYYYAHFTGAPGIFFMNMGGRLLELSIKEFEAAVSLEPTPGAMVNLAIAKASYYSIFRKEMIIQEKYRDVIEVLEKAISVHPSYAMAYFHLGLIQLRVDDLESASISLNKALELFRSDESDVDIWCLHNRDDHMFNQMMRRYLNENLILFCKGNEHEAMTNIRRLYQTVTIYYIACIKESRGHIHEAVEHLMEASNLYAGTGYIMSSTAKLLGALDYREEGLVMFKKAIALSPLNIELRNEFIKLLYLYGRDREAVSEIRMALKLVKTIAALKEKSITLKETINGLNRLSNDTPFSFDKCKTEILYEHAGIVFEYLKKDPGNINLIINLINIWSDTGRTESLFDLVDEYMEHHFKQEHADEETRVFLARLYETLRELSVTESRMHSEKIAALRSGIKGIRDKKVHCPV